MARNLPGMKYRLRSVDGFLDGNVLPGRIIPGQVVEVDWQTYQKCLQSDPSGWEVVGLVPPAPVKAEELSDGSEKESTPGLQEGTGEDSSQAGNKPGKRRGNTGKQQPVSFPSSEEG